MKKLMGTIAIVAFLATSLDAAIAQTRPPSQTQGMDANTQAKKAWFEKAIDDILTGPIEAPVTGRGEQGRSSGGPTRH